ncbi:MAG: sulfite exporter TauE/SafE family protein [Betaproteobacteria bacterium]|nr:sulfite exporter TauE/SafE family protein [Betaproteobacteria bacterium]
MDLILFALTGLVSGFLAGLLGVGGGLIIVPALLYTLPHAGFGPAVLVHVAVGSSLAVITVTALASVRAHHARGAVEWPVVRAMTPGICAGALLGSVLAGHLPGLALRWVYVVFLLGVSAQMLLELRPAAGRDMPGLAGMALAGAVIGGFSSLVGIGGGTLSTPFLLWCRRSIHVAVGTSAAIGLPIAVAGGLGFVLAGWGRTDLPAGEAIGFVAWRAVLVVGAVSTLLAPVGARLAHALPQRQLKRVFAMCLLLLAARFLFELV